MREILFRAKDLSTGKWRYGGVAMMFSIFLEDEVFVITSDEDGADNE